MKYTINYITYDPVTTISKCEIQTIDGTFRAESKPDMFDKDMISNYFGCTIAEYKCLKKACKRRMQNIRQKIRAMHELKADCEYAGFDDHHRIDMKLNDYRNQLKFTMQEYLKTEETIKYFIEMHEEIKKKIKINEELDQIN